LLAVNSAAALMLGFGWVFGSSFFFSSPAGLAASFGASLVFAIELTAGLAPLLLFDAPAPELEAGAELLEAGWLLDPPPQAAQNSADNESARINFNRFIDITSLQSVIRNQQ
jgi:hypothetical protein